MENNDQVIVNEEDSIDLLPILRAWLKNWWLILIVMLLCGALAFAVTKFAVTPMYRSSFSAYVNNKTTSEDGDYYLSNSDLSAARSLAQTYSVIVKSQAVLEHAAEKANYAVSFDTLSRNISTEVADDTEILTVYVEAVSPAQARQLADAIAEALTENGPEIVEGSSMKIIDKPREMTSPSSPNVKKNVAIGMLAGIVVILAILTLKTLSNTTLNSEALLEERFGLPILGTIPRQDDAEKVTGYSYGGAGKRKNEVKKNG